MEFEAFAGLQKGTRNPARRQAQEPASFLEGTFNDAFDVLRNFFQSGNGIHAPNGLGGAAGFLKPKEENCCEAWQLVTPDPVCTDMRALPGFGLNFG